ncbi:MAG: factor-independent urate hydroxylase [Janthinobacterium lividum]
MPLISHTYGKARVRVMRIHRDGDYNEVRETGVQIMLDGDFAASFTDGDNRTVVATDTIKNIAYIVARETLTASVEDYGQAIAARFLQRYDQVTQATVSLHETRWTRASFAGRPHPHSFVLDANGKPTATVVAPRGAAPSVTSGIAGYTFLKSTGSGWVDFVMDDYTTLPPTADRVAATAMDAQWTWLSPPPDYEAANALVLSTMLEVFATTYSRGVQDSLFRMGEAALAAVPELATIRMACPNKHYLPTRLEPFGMSSDNTVFIATDEPHGQIECVVGR